MISIIFPHVMNDENDAVLKLKHKMIRENATFPYEILMFCDTGRPDLVYESWDWMMRRAKYELILWDNSDIVYAAGFMDNVVKHKDDADWIGLELVECGAIPVADTNICIDFGRTARTFNRPGFEKWATQMAKGRPSLRPGFCWYSPSVWKRDWYVAMGGFDLSRPFPYPNDVEFRNRCEKAGARFAVANSFAYHFQRAQENRGEVEERK